MLYQLSYWVVMWGALGLSRSHWPLTLTFNQIGTQRSGSDLERKNAPANVEFSPPGGNGTQQGDSDVAGMGGIEPPMRESKSRALTAWLHPYVKNAKAGADFVAPAIRVLWGG